jgi:hypothetical protein
MKQVGEPRIFKSINLLPVFIKINNVGARADSSEEGLYPFLCSKGFAVQDEDYFIQQRKLLNRPTQRGISEFDKAIDKLRTAQKFDHAASIESDGLAKETK